MIEKNTTTYSLIGSLGVHMFLTLGAGSFLMNINKNVQPPKTYKLEFIKRKTPPPVKKKEMRKEMVRREIKVASLTPKAIPVVQPKTTVRQISKARPAITTPQLVPRKLAPQIPTLQCRYQRLRYQWQFSTSSYTLSSYRRGQSS